jgi:hypothetical protein
MGMGDGGWGMGMGSTIGWGWEKYHRMGMGDGRSAAVGFDPSTLRRGSIDESCRREAESIWKRQWSAIWLHGQAAISA